MEYKTYECIVCGWIYYEEHGVPEDGIEPGTKWEDVPEELKPAAVLLTSDQ